MNNHVSPTELEEILQAHPAVQECLVYGKREERVQEVVSAVVVLKPGVENEVKYTCNTFKGQIPYAFT